LVPVAGGEGHGQNRPRSEENRRRRLGFVGEYPWCGEETERPCGDWGRRGAGGAEEEPEQGGGGGREELGERRKRREAAAASKCRVWLVGSSFVSRTCVQLLSDTWPTRWKLTNASDPILPRKVDVVDAL
jgi:hypothetical protein